VAIMVMFCGHRGDGLWPSWFVAVIAVAVMVMVCGHHGFVAVIAVTVMVCGRHGVGSITLYLIF